MDQKIGTIRFHSHKPDEFHPGVEEHSLFQALRRSLFSQPDFQNMLVYKSSNNSQIRMNYIQSLAVVVGLHKWCIMDKLTESLNLMGDLWTI